MRKIILYLLLAIPVLSHAQQNKFKIKGKLGNSEPGSKVYLSYLTENGSIPDSSTISNGEFYFEGIVSEIALAVLYLKPTKIEFINGEIFVDQKRLYLDKGEVVVTAKDSLKNATITGSAINDENIRYETFIDIQNTKEKLAALNAELTNASEAKRNDSAFKEQIETKRKEIIKKEAEQKKLFIKKNPSSYFSLVSLMNMVESKMEAATIETYFNSLSANLRSGWYGRLVAKGIERIRNTSIGGIAPAITLPDSSGKLVSLSDFKSKYVLIDFWASWCQPCRAGNVNLVSAYKKYHPKGFEILGVSLDELSYKANWLDAVKKDGLTWPQVNDAKAANGEVAQSYGITEIPYNFLVGPDGKIVSVNLHGEALNKKLAELLDK